MGIVSRPSAVKLFVAFLYNDSASVEEVLKKLDSRFGERQYCFGPIPFDWTDYYSREMGASLKKMYFSYRSEIDRDMLPSIKLFTNNIEQAYTDGRGGRTVNIDPGYISRDKVVLASTKDFYHRLYLADGIFGEVTLHYRKGRFRYFSWTYPDFRSAEVIAFLERVRAAFVKDLRSKSE